jgi:hypothetical protein
VRRCTCDMYGDRKTSAVCNCHDLSPLAALRFPDAGPPFLAPTKVPSMKPSRRSMPPRSRRSLASAARIVSNVSSATHSWNLRWHVWYGGYLGGKSFHGAPVRMIHRMPLSTSRAARRGRPRPSAGRSGGGISGSSSAHCSSVRSIDNGTNTSRNRWK